MKSEELKMKNDCCLQALFMSNTLSDANEK